MILLHWKEDQIKKAYLWYIFINYKLWSEHNKINNNIFIEQCPKYNYTIDTSLVDEFQIY